MDSSNTLRSLLPCPFCGQEPILLCVTEGADNFEREYIVRCEACAISFAEEYRSDARKAWNTRAALQQPAAEPVDEWVTVPRVPTRAMLNAAVDVDSFKLGDISPLGFRISPQMLFERCFEAMVTASPVREPAQPDTAK